MDKHPRKMANTLRAQARTLRVSAMLLRARGDRMVQTGMAMIDAAASTHEASLKLDNEALAIVVTQPFKVHVND